MANPAHPAAIVASNVWAVAQTTNAADRTGSPAAIVASNVWAVAQTTNAAEDSWAPTPELPGDVGEETRDVADGGFGVVAGGVVTGGSDGGEPCVGDEPDDLIRAFG